MSRFVSGGSLDKPAERDEAWKKAQVRRNEYDVFMRDLLIAEQEEIEANHRAKEEAAAKQDGKSLYETLQANKGP